MPVMGERLKLSTVIDVVLAAAVVVVVVVVGTAAGEFRQSDYLRPGCGKGFTPHPPWVLPPSDTTRY